MLQISPQHILVCPVNEIVIKHHISPTLVKFIFVVKFVLVIKIILVMKFILKLKIIETRSQKLAMCLVGGIRLLQSSYHPNK